MEQSNQEFLKQLQEKLSQPITPSWRVQSFSDQKPFAVVIPYLDKLDVMRALDNAAIYGWQRDHYNVFQDIYCKIGINMPDGSVHWRADCGTGGSGIEIEKTKASDSFKRAGANWWIGRNLSEVEIVRVNTNLPLDKNNKSAPKPYVVDSKGNRVWDITVFINEQIKSGALKVENVFTLEPTQPVSNPPAETKAPAKKKPETTKPEEALPEKPASALQPSESFDKPEAKTTNPDEAEARKTALELYLKKDQSKILAHIIKGHKITKYATVTDFVNQHPLDKVREIYAEINKVI